MLASFSVGIVGCGSVDESHDEHDDEYAEHEHLEHFVPAHKPKDFVDLVEQLALRFHQLDSTDAGDEPRTARQELADIIGWIPELAADSELKKADFESAVATGNKLVAVFTETLGAKKTKPFDAVTFKPFIEELRKLAPQSRDRKEQM